MLYTDCLFSGCWRESLPIRSVVGKYGEDGEALRDPVN